ncbi:pilus assembly FimT family protein (plasmid) [Deinococcus sp. PESE-38]
MRWREGYTLLEMLTVLAILGIIAGAFFLALMPQIRAQRLHEVGVTLAGELKRARTQAQKSGADVLVSWNAGSFNTHVSGTTGADRVVNLPEGTRIITPTPAPGALGYEAPHGTAFFKRGAGRLRADPRRPGRAAARCGGPGHYRAAEGAGAGRAVKDASSLGITPAP